MNKKEVLSSVIFFAFSLVIHAQDSQLKNRPRHDIYLAAADSYRADKERADLVCTGKNDQMTIQRAINALERSGTVYLAAGNYYIDAFQQTAAGPHYAIKTNEHSKIKITGSERANGAFDSKKPSLTGTRFIVTAKCYSLLNDTTQYAVIRGDTKDDYDAIMSQELTINNLTIWLPDNQKRIICIDGAFLGAMNVDACRLGTSYYNRSWEPDQTLHVGVDGCIGIRGLQGSNNGSETIFKSTYAVGLGVGFQLSGEHLVCIQLGAIGNKYGYTFNGFDHKFGCWCHPITLINCCDEVSANYPYFGANEYGQSINLINFNIENYTTILSADGHYAREAVPGQWHGNIDYDIQDWEYNIRNSPFRRFWAGDGSGKNITSKNNVHNLSYTSEELSHIAPNVNQIVFNTTEGKPVMCLNAGDYACAKLCFRTANRKAGKLMLKVGHTERSIELPRTFKTIPELTEYVFRHLFVNTTCKYLRQENAILIYNQYMGKIDDKQIGLSVGETMLGASIELSDKGRDNQWIDMAGNKIGM